MTFGRGALLWLIGIPLPIILLLAIFWRTERDRIGQARRRYAVRSFERRAGNLLRQADRAVADIAHVEQNDARARRGAISAEAETSGGKVFSGAALVG